MAGGSNRDLHEHCCEESVAESESDLLEGMGRV